MPKKSNPAAATVESLEPIIVKIVQAVRPGDVIFIECDQARTTQQLQHLHEQIKQKLPEIKIVILNKGATLSKVQTMATLATKQAGA